MIKHKKTGVIFIDCWDQNWQWQNLGNSFHNFYLNMLDTLSGYDIDSYVFHTSFLNLNYVTPDVLKYFKEFVVDQKLPVLQRDAIRDLVQSTGTERLAKELHPLATSSKGIFVPTYKGFVQWCQTSDISQWIVVGAHWPICTHTKPLGFENLQKYKQSRPHMRFYSIPSCTAKWVHTEDEQLATVLTDADYQADTVCKWQNVGKDLYELIL